MADDENRPSWIAKGGFVVAVLSLVISVSSAVFSYRQWQTTEENSKINAAIDLSTKDIQDTGITKMLTDFRVWFNNGAAYGKIDPETVAAENYVFYLDYVAQLINSSRVNEDYISLLLKCGTLNVYRNLYVNNAPDTNLPMPSKIANLSRFYERHKGMDCHLISR